MAVNKNALIRYKTIDKCLQNQFRQWTLNDLIEAVSDALYEYEGKDVDVSKRTVQLDLQMMRSDKLGYNAPIVVYDRKFYKYEDAEYSITNSPISNQDLSKLSEAVSFLKQFQGFSHFSELGSMVQKLEDHVYTQKTHEKSLIDFEKNDNLKGIEFLDQLYQFILKKEAIEITYQSFKARKESTFVFHGYLLKEFRNRWFLIGKRQKNEGIMNLALDRIITIRKSDNPYILDSNFDIETFYKNAIGVSVSPTLEPENVLLYVNHKQAPYVLTKPFHHSQKEVSRDHFGVTISLDVQLNFELEKEILGLGEGIKVIAPERLKRNIKERLYDAVDTYETEINEKSLRTISKRLEHKGFGILNHVFTKRDIRKLKTRFDTYFKNHNEQTFGMREVLLKMPELKEILFNKNFKKLIKSIDKNAFLTKAIYFDKSPKDNWYVTWHQDVPINVLEKIETDGFSAWTNKKGVISVRPTQEISKNTFSMRIHLDDTTIKNGALKVIPGSHNKHLQPEEIKLISENSIPFVSEIAAGGVQLLKPLLLHASSETTVQKRRRVLHLEFSSIELPNGLSYAEREDLFVNLQ
ncbi:Predicted DNA-binding transcriptional regulator YafY, contains an HTH and WYL domains [Winogradskyella thalassocola]|uniref:Predicted DNA-binding transcriptional regulator YafY, contains an HTH and WYL domains n=2 Tax=Winogradskyella thalassocola TaxID=262004 RepID=A0A1G7X8W1_9FLAO|nr:Predicted DNA-binding transcriptional regulator YafY, contains an HTH and WYL domains [Winogradskyella thalassocola]